MDENEKKFLILLENPGNPIEKTVRISEDGADLLWPVVFLYPEYGQTDFVESFNENTKLLLFKTLFKKNTSLNKFLNSQRFNEILEDMFKETPGWDSEGKYKKDSIEVIFVNVYSPK